MNTSQTGAAGDLPILTAQSVEDYLRRHPDFFQGRDDLIRALTLPHPTGGAISLVERQVALLREETQRYRAQLQELVQIARYNDELIARLQQLTVKLMDCTTLDEALALLETGLRQDFHADAATLRLFPASGLARFDADALGFLNVEAIEPDRLASSLQPILTAGRPACGHLPNEQLVQLFPTTAGEIGSAALLPLAGGAGEPVVGLLAIGSRNAERFTPEMGTTYLNYMNELIGRKLAACLRDAAPA
ncbi:MAG: DUF484 family protein [Gammaproteobacteria bacterium]|nr:DUF484 family protein [Gammaproteobacteria bacterium]